MTFAYQPFAYIPPPGLTAPEPRHKVLIVGAGPIGLALAIDLAQHGVASIVLDDNDVVSVGSRAICWSKRSLEILDRLGIGERCRDQGVTWQVGRTFHRDTEIWNFDLLPEAGHKMPAFVNLQQYYVEDYLVARAQEFPDLIDLRWKNKVTGLTQTPDAVTVNIETPDGPYALETDHLLACDGARSPVRGLMGLAFEGEPFDEQFLIADIEMTSDRPAERWFWFEPTFHPGQSALLHKQPDNIYRIDLQLGPDADAESERQPDKIIPRIARVVGHSDFRLDWASIYRFQCRRLARFVQGRIIFAGDSAHVVSPFGARGGNGGLQDVDALGWRLAAVAQGRAAPAILRDYDRERQYGADENIAASARTTRFMTPANGIERTFRDAILHLAARAPFARPLVNSGRLSRPCTYPLDAPDAESLPATARPGAVAPDAAIDSGWLMNALGQVPVLLALGQPAPAVPGLRSIAPALTFDLTTRYLGGASKALYLIRPDQVIAARWTTASVTTIQSAVAAIWGPAA